MRCIHAITLTAAFLAPFIEGLELRKRDSPRVVGLPLERRSNAAVVSNTTNQLSKRGPGTLEAVLDNTQTLYLANITLGGQPFRLHIDTGSSDLWVNAVNSTFCQPSIQVKNIQEDRMSTCLQSGMYDANASSTYNYVGSHFNITYRDGTAAVGDYVTDEAKIAGAKIKNFQFGVGYETKSGDGIMGIGYPQNEVQVGRAKKEPYPNLPAAMVEQGIISQNAYSLWLNDLDASSGRILFGGVDTEKYQGELATIPIQKSDGKYTNFLITLTGISFNNTSIAKNVAQAVLVDCGSTLTYLPNAMATKLFDLVDAQYDAEKNAAFVPCSLKSNTSTLDFTFSEPTIKVPIDELVLPVNTTQGESAYFPSGEQVCLFGVAPAGVKTPILGDTFLRSAYVVFDLDRNEISLAQTRWNISESNIVEIGAKHPGDEGNDDDNGSRNRNEESLGVVPGASKVEQPVKATAGVGRVFDNAGLRVVAYEIMGLVVCVSALGIMMLEVL